MRCLEATVGKSALTLTTANGPRAIVHSLRPRTLAGILSIAAIYFAAAKLGLSMAVSAEQVSAVWPPTGIALAAVLIFGVRISPGIWLGAFVANATAQEPIGTACGIAIGNTLEAVIGAYLLRRAGFDISLERLKDVFNLIIWAACVSTAVSATIGVVSLVLSGLHPPEDFLALWSVWWLGDAMGNIVIAPLILTLATTNSMRSPHRAVEALALALGLTAVGILVLNGKTPSESVRYSFVYTIFPFVIWAALRFGQRGTAIVTFAASVFAITGALNDAGPFGSGPIQDRLMSLQVFLGIVAVTGLMLAAILSERRRDEERKSLLHAVTRILAESATLAEAAPQIVQRVCNSLSWQVGAIWQVDRSAASLDCAGVWHVGPKKFTAFEAKTKQSTFKNGVGLPGRVWASGEPAWIPDVVHDSNFPRAAVAAQDGLHAAFGFPIRLGAEIHGVIELFSSQVCEPDDDLLQTISTIGIQIGQFIERRRGDEETRRSEALKTAILDSALDTIITINAQGLIVEFNPAAVQMFGWDRTEAIGKPFVELIVSASWEEPLGHELAHYLANVEGPTLGRRLELIARKSNGAEFPVELTVGRIPFPGPPMFTGYIRDITARKQLEAELRGRAEQLIEEDQHKNEFLATLAHELRNPLAPLRNGLQILRLARRDPDTVEQVHNMLDRQVAQMVRLVDDLLDLSRISRGAIELRKERLELATIVRQAVETSLPAIEQAGHQITIDVPQSPIYIDADLTRMAQVFSNILNNAAKYTEVGGRVHLAVQLRSGEAVVSIKDNGIGIPADMLPNVFDMFTQVDRNLERSQDGLGIGLSIVKRLVEMHGGVVEVRSEGHGKGSEFIVRMPVVLSVVQPQPEAKVTGANDNCRVLVVDDNRDAAISLALMLKLIGNETRAAHDGLEALELAEAFRPDLILLDIGMPTLNGYETAKRIRQQPWGKEVIIVALTGWGLDEDRRKSQEAGFDSHMVKPIQLHELEKLLASSKSPIAGSADLDVG
jgi:PAS domain S-box-containing protein